MNKIFFSIFTVIILLFSGLFVFPASSLTIKSISLAKTWYVDDNFNESTPGWNITNFSKIQYAIDNATAGDTIFVFNGTYQENILINKSIIFKR